MPSTQSEKTYIATIDIMCPMLMTNMMCIATLYTNLLILNLTLSLE